VQGAPAADRPSVDVVIPFAGSLGELESLLARASALRSAPGDSITVVDNRAAGAPAPSAVPPGVRLLAAPERPSSYHARNRGAAAGTCEWIVFLDADVEPGSELLDRYFTSSPAERTAVLAGGVVDEPLGDDGRPTLAARYAFLRGRMGQENTLGNGAWGYAQTANCAVRRAAFDAVGGFTDDIRSGGDADLCFRLRAAGWEIEERGDAAVVHRSRHALRAMLRQRARHGSGVAWLERHYPGSFPHPGWLFLAKSSVVSFGLAVRAAVRGHSDEALMRLIDPIDEWAFELGRKFPNDVRARR
jgi:hypothetical protein